MASMRRCLVGGLLPLVIAAVSAAGCAASDDAASESASTAPHLLALSSYSASLGSPIDAFMANPPPADARKIELVFDGTFTRPGGRAERIALTQPTNRTEAGAVRWTTFGPFANPFTPTDPDIGVFTGTVGIRVTGADGKITEDDKPIPVRFEVKPSIVIQQLEPTSASCGTPALRLIGGMAYRLKASTIGFDAKTIEYSLQTPGVIPDQTGKPVFDTESDGRPRYLTRQLAHTMVNNIDTVDGKEAFVLPPVPLDQPNYGAVMAIVARDEQGRSVATTFGMTAHAPIELFYDGRFELAQIYPAKPVSSCIPGGQQGRQVEYSEAQTETRQRQLSVTISKSFLQTEENNWSTSDGKTITRSTTNTDGYSRSHSTTNAFTFTKSHSDTSGVSFTWSDGETIGGEAKVGFKPFGLGAEASVKGEKRWDRSRSENSSSTDGWSSSNTTSDTDTSEVNHSTATTDSTAVSQTDTKGGSASQQQGEGEAIQDAWTVSSSQTIQRGFSASVIANTQGVFYRQMARYTQRAFVVVYNKCGEGDVIGDVTLQDYVWAPDLALGEQCPPLPASNFPQPQCYLPPCDP